MKQPKLLIALILFLTVTNIATILTVVIHIRQAKNNLTPATQSSEPAGEMPSTQRVAYFARLLQLTPEQQEQFRELSMKYNRNASGISSEMARLRNRQLREMTVEQPDMGLLTNLSEEIGLKHTELKNLTIEYYLGLKKVCSREQQEELYRIFEQILNPQGDVDLPGGQRGRGDRGGGPPADRGRRWQNRNQ